VKTLAVSRTGPGLKLGPGFFLESQFKGNQSKERSLLTKVRDQRDRAKKEAESKRGPNNQRFNRCIKIPCWINNGAGDVVTEGGVPFGGGRRIEEITMKGQVGEAVR